MWMFINKTGSLLTDTESGALALGAECLARVGDTFRKPTGRSGDYDGYTYTVCGFAARRPKYPVSVIRSDGRKFKFTIERANALVGRTLNSSPSGPFVGGFVSEDDQKETS